MEMLIFHGTYHIIKHLFNPYLRVFPFLVSHEQVNFLNFWTASIIVIYEYIRERLVCVWVLCD